MHTHELQPGSATRGAGNETPFKPCIRMSCNFWAKSSFSRRSSLQAMHTHELQPAYYIKLATAKVLQAMHTHELQPVFWFSGS